MSFTLDTHVLHVYIDGDDSSPQLYSGAMKLKDMSDWLKKLSSSSKKAAAGKKASSTSATDDATATKKTKTVKEEVSLVPLLAASHIEAIQESSGYTIFLFANAATAADKYVASLSDCAHVMVIDVDDVCVDHYQMS